MSCEQPAQPTWSLFWDLPVMVEPQKPCLPGGISWVALLGHHQVDQVIPYPTWPLRSSLFWRGGMSSSTFQAPLPFLPQGFMSYPVSLIIISLFVSASLKWVFTPCNQNSLNKIEKGDSFPSKPLSPSPRRINHTFASTLCTFICSSWKPRGISESHAFYMPSTWSDTALGAFSLIHTATGREGWKPTFYRWDNRSSAVLHHTPKVT